jgi:hypothetical protein
MPKAGSPKPPLSQSLLRSRLRQKQRSGFAVADPDVPNGNLQNAGDEHLLCWYGRCVLWACWRLTLASHISKGAESSRNLKSRLATRHNS